MIRAVTFDWWHTIAEPHLNDPEQGSVRSWEEFAKEARVNGIAAVLRLFEMETSTTVLSTAYDRWTEGLAELWKQQVDMTAEEQVLEFLESAGLGGKAVPALLLALEEPIGSPLVLKPPTIAADFPEVARALREQGLAVGLISNTGRTWGRFIRRVQEGLGIADLFDACLFSDEVRHRKPSPHIFTSALHALGLPAAEVVHIGDDPVADVQGAQAVGMRGILCDRTGALACDYADARIARFTELPEALRRW